MNFQRILIKTNDGSSSIFLPEWNEHYHSIHGAVQEANHVFIEKGLKYVNKQRINVLEMGFGTGLNTLITYFESEKLQKIVNYYALEAYPITQIEYESLNYHKVLKFDNVKSVFDTIYFSSWELKNNISTHFNLHKKQMLFEDFQSKPMFDLIYFDAFGARVQPELWTEKMFQKMFDALVNKGILVTYSAKGSVRRAMQSVGFQVERLPGPPGKREMLRGCKV